MSLPICQIPVEDAQGRRRIASAPRLVCDRCGETIEDLAEGMFLWDAESAEPGPQPATRHVHTLCDEFGPSRLPYSQEIAVGLIYLLRNAGLFDGHGRPTQAWRDAWRRAQLLSSLL